MEASTISRDTYTMGGDGPTVARMGYGAMQLAGRGVFGPPRDRAAAVAVLREAVSLGVNHIDTSDYYGPHITNQIIREALHPYPEGLCIVTKVGAVRNSAGNWLEARKPEQLRTAVHDNLRNLGLDALDVVNMRIGGLTDPEPGSVADCVGALAEMRQEGLIRHLGISNASAEQIAEAQRITPIVCVQNLYNVASRRDDALLDSLAEQDIAYVPYFPLGGFSSLQSKAMDAVAARVGAAPLTVALAWLLQRSPNILLIPGTSSVAHLRENVAAAGLALAPEDVEALDRIAG